MIIPNNPSRIAPGNFIRRKKNNFFKNLYLGANV